METWLQEHFEPNSTGFLLVFSDLEQNESIWFDHTQTTDVFGAISTPPAYEELSALTIASQGWQRIFDQWKEKRIV